MKKFIFLFAAAFGAMAQTISLCGVIYDGNNFLQEVYVYFADNAIQVRWN